MASESSSRFPLVSDPSKVSSDYDKFTTPAPEGEVIQLPDVNVTAKATPTAELPDVVVTTPAPATAQPKQAEELQFQEGAWQWLRKIDLTLYASTKGGDKGAGVSLSLLRVDFRLTKATNQSPNFLDLKVYNLAPETISKVRQYGRVQLSAGYRDNFGMIFDGTVVMYITGKENPVDSYVNIIAGDGTEYLTNSVSSLTFPPGSKGEDQAKTALQESGQPIGEINFGKDKGQATLRYSHYLGDTQRFIRNLMNAANADFFIDDGKAYAISRSGYRQSEIVKLGPTTGLVGFPRVTPSGIEAMCLLNPKLRIGGQVKIELKNPDGTDAIMDIPYVPGADQPFESAANTPVSTQSPYALSAASLSKDGIYKIYTMTHHGDTHGNPWYTELICSAGADAIAPGTALRRTAAKNP